MDLVVAAPGVPTERLRSALESDHDGLLLVDRLTRCGVPTAEPAAADRLRVAVAPCRSSLHAADRFRRRLPVGVGVDAVLIAGDGRRVVTEGGRNAVRTWADGRFGCPIEAVEPAEPAAHLLPTRY